MLARTTRWLLISTPVLAGIVVLIAGTARAISVAFGIPLISIGGLVWMSNWFIRLSFDDHGRRVETIERESRAREQRTRLNRAQRAAAHRDAPRDLTKRRRRPQ